MVRAPSACQEVGLIKIVPDQFDAELVARSTSASAAAAQRQVNSLMADGMKMGHAVAGVDARAVGYSGIR